MFKQTLSKKSFRITAAILFALVAVIAFMLLSGTKADAKVKVIKTPKQMRNLNWKGKGFGPGTYKLGNSMTLSDDISSDENGTCLLTKGKFVIDLNGHTLQSSDPRCTVIDIRGATVTLKDSKAKTAKRSRPSIRSYGQGAVQITKGKLTIKNGYYCGASNGQNDPVGLHVGGGTCTVQGGTFDGDHVGASTMGGKLRINGGTFKTSYMFGLLNMAGNIKITKATIKNTKSNSFNPTFAIGAYTGGNSYSFKKWLASGSKFSPTISTIYWNGSSTDVSQTPTRTVLAGRVYVPTTYNYAAGYTGNSGYESVTIKVKTKGAPAATKITSLKARSKGLTVKWKKQSKKTSGYQVQYSTSKKFKGKKTVTIKGKKKNSRVLKKLKGGKKYFVRVRAYRSINGTKLYSKWSKVKSKKTKK